MKKYIFALFLLFIFYNLFSVPPCPEKKSGIINFKEYPSEKFSKYKNTKNFNVPDSILIILTEFSDIKFRDDSTSFDGFNHDKKYFKKYMEHLSEYWFDASHGKYNLEESYYTFYQNIITLPKTMAYYGNDEAWSERVAEFFQEIIQTVDTDINFRNFDSIIIFHAGAGQETDVSGNNSDDLWTTFVTRKSLQSGLDPENDQFQGILTNDGIYVNEAIIMPESELQPDYTEGSTKYGMLGVLAHEFGHLLGLPTLFDNYSSNGRSAGIGNFGVMGTGVWNANGFVPPLPCAWSRYYMGWEDENLITINSDMQNCEIAYPMMTTFTPKLYKINISPKEYFLLENRQQNPDNSTIHGFPNFTFPLLPDSLQDYYPPPNDDVPVFNFMENSYAGCEWDFFLPGPGYGEPPGSDNVTVNGSGLFIWHIDEYMIDMLFDPDFEMNYVNYDASHKGVDLEEATGFQYLDSIQTMDSFGTPYDSYRQGNNTYFGLPTNPETGLISYPTAESYYGGINLEIYDISASSNIMNFSVRFSWNLNPDYIGNAKYPPLITSFDDSGLSTIINVMPSGHIFLWDENEELDHSLSFTLNPIVQLYAFDEFSKKLILPAYSNNRASYYIFSNDIADFSQIFLNQDYKWATNPIVNNNPNALYRAFLPLNNKNQQNSEIVVLDNDLQITYEKPIENYHIITNMMLKENELFILLSDSLNVFLGIWDFDNSDDIAITNLSELSRHNIISAVTADIDNDKTTDLIITDSDSLLYVFNRTGELFNNFPVKMDLNAFSVPSIADVDNNGEADILIGGENSFLLVDKTGKIMHPYLETSYPDSLCRASGVIPFSMNNNYETDVIGNFSKNRLAIWKFKNYNDFVLKEEPVVFREYSPFAPIISVYQTNKTEKGIFAFVAGHNGLIFRKKLSDNTEFWNDNDWHTVLANNQRTASYSKTTHNTFQSGSVFVSSQTYIYPNPLSKINSGAIFAGDSKQNHIAVRFMITKDALVEMKYYDIAGNLLGKNKKNATNYVSDIFYIDANKLSSGVYLCTLKCGNKVKKLKFAIEK